MYTTIGWVVLFENNKVTQVQVGYAYLQYMDDRVTLMVVEKYPQSTLENRGNLIRGVNISFTGLLLKRK